MSRVLCGCNALKRRFTARFSGTSGLQSESVVYKEFFGRFL